jgi:hypothetical protein
MAHEVQLAFILQPAPFGSTFSPRIGFFSRVGAAETTPISSKSLFSQRIA